MSPKPSRQFARFAPQLARQGAEVTLFCAPALARLFGGIEGVHAIAAAGAVEFPEPDCWAFGLDVPGRLGIGLEQLSGAPYLAAAAPPAQPLSARVGVMRRGNPAHGNDANRSLPDAIPLPFEAMSLAPQDTGARDMQDTADLIAGLDLVVTVDTSVAHLAGALGKPAFVMLPAVACDWRWMSGRTDTPWYESLTLFRQARPGDWAEVVERVGRAVRARLAA